MRISLLIVTIIISLILGLIVLAGNPSAQTNVEVGAEVGICFLDITVLPEKRLPKVDNWQTETEVRIYRSSDDNFMGSFVTNTNFQGFASVNLCDLGIFMTAGTYDFYITGKSHLTKLFPNIIGFTEVLTEIDLSTSGVLLAGETSNIFDNYVNVLDISVMVSGFLGTADVLDLNQDGIVNSLDISNSVTNFLVAGDTLP